MAIIAKEPVVFRRSSALTFVATLFIIICSLHLAKDVLVPIAMAILVSFVLAPLVGRLEKFRLPRVPSVLLVTIFSFSLLAGLGWLFTQQITDLARDIPGYTTNLRQRAKSLRPPGDSIFSGLRKTVEAVNKEIDPPAKVDATKPENRGSIRTGHAGESPNTAIWTKQVESPPSPFELIVAALSPIVAPLGTAGIVAVLCVFILIQREDLRDRLIRLFGEGQLSITTQAIDDAASKVSRYLSMQLLVNTFYGVSVAIGLYAIGVPNALLWALLCAVLRFIPYVGTWCGAAMPLALSLAAFPGWTIPLTVFGMFVVLDLIIANVAEPFLFGKSTGLTPLAVLLTALFWTWTWGAIGLILSTPLTVCLVVVGKYVPSLEFFTVLFGDRPALLPHVRVFQRLLASDTDEPLLVMQEVLKSHSLDYFYEGVLIPALTIAEESRQRGLVDEYKAVSVRDSIREIIDEAEEFASAKADALTEVKKEISPRVIFLPAREDADEIAALIYSNLLNRGGYESKVISLHTVGDKLAGLVKNADDTVIISAMSLSSLGRVKTLLRWFGGVSSGDKAIVLGLWNGEASLSRAKERLTHYKELTILTNYEEILKHLKKEQTNAGLRKTA